MMDLETKWVRKEDHNRTDDQVGVNVETRFTRNLKPQKQNDRSFKIAKVWDKVTKDFTEIKQIKEEQRGFKPG